jgi:hypothetical protein
MEKRGVIDENTPSGCCGGKPKCEDATQTTTSGEQMLLKFGESVEPTTAKEADDIERSSMTEAIDAVIEETDKDVE